MQGHVEQPAAEPVVARVDGRPLYASDLREQMAGGETRAAALASLIRLEVLAREARRRGLQATPAVIDAERRAMAALLARRFGAAITPERVDRALILKAYKANETKFKRPETVRVSHLLCIQRRGDKAKVRAGARRCRDAVSAWLARHKPTLEQFEKLPELFRATAAPARVKTERLTTPRRGFTVEAFADAAFEAKIGQVAGPVETRFGYHFIYKIEAFPAVNREFADAEKELRERFLPEARSVMFERWARTLEERHRVQTDVTAFLSALGDRR